MAAEKERRKHILEQQRDIDKRLREAVRREQRLEEMVGRARRRLEFLLMELSLARDKRNVLEAVERSWR